MSISVKKCDFLVVGGGVAGLNAALESSRYGKVVLVSKSTLNESSSYLAQGGVAAVLDSNDSFEDHIYDTLSAGRKYCDIPAVNILVEEGAKQVRELIDLGMPFEKKGEKLSLGMEGGHSKRRILYANGAATGQALVIFLAQKVEESKEITVLEDIFIYDLICQNSRCVGAAGYLYQEGQTIFIRSKATILATGGYSALFNRTTNPHTSTGDGLWLALNAGATLKDLEFVQFHPTAFYKENESAFLISEALRGEGARLYNTTGSRFMEGYPEKELSPRDVVSREIFRQIEQQDENYVYLDLQHLKYTALKKRFPGLVKKIEKEGIDITKEGIPVAPAAHYSIGGIETGLSGQTRVAGLYACGEVAATGVHGANRLASNSLLECLVFSKRAVEHAKQLDPPLPLMNISIKPFTYSSDLEEAFIFQKNVITRVLNRYAGIERTSSGIHLALNYLSENLKSPLYHQGNEYYFIRMREMIRIAEMILTGALSRTESRGVHFRKDYPEPALSPLKSTIFRKNQNYNIQAVS